MSSFEPYFDYDSLTDEMVSDLGNAVRQRGISKIALEENPSVQTASHYLESHERFHETISDIQGAIWTVPVMVHVAGDKKLEHNPDDPSEEAVVQRCTRCGSALHYWAEGLRAITPDGVEIIDLEEADVPWWDNGDIVAKSTVDTSINMYEIDPERELRKHELECVNMPDFDFEELEA